MEEDFGGYLPGEGGKHRRLEVSIPVLLLILVFIVVAWKLGWLASIPVIGDVFGAPALNVLLVGQDNNIRSQLEEIRTDLRINVDPISIDQLNSIASPEYLKKYNLVILSPTIAENGADLPDTFRNYLGKYLEGNGKLVMYGVAGSRDPKSSSTNGWVAHIGDFIPVRCRDPPTLGVCDAQQSSFQFPVTKLSMKVLQPENSIVKEFGTTVPFDQGGSVTVTPVNVVKGSAQTLVRIDYDPGTGETRTFAAVVWYEFGFGGKVVYFAYEPWKTPRLFQNVIKALR
ncbi:hypothetical protein HYS54_00010 [Candidatus Micrarchaeota archaeon]|nr:hypothetical protein [Candidatus Micrarchaeota archaeon]